MHFPMKILKHTRYLLETLFILIWLLIARILPLDWASDFSGWLGRCFGGLLKGSSQKAFRNLDRAMPELSKDAQKELVRDMWDNLGRIIGEHANLNRLYHGNRIQITGMEHLRKADESGRTLLFVTAHFGNWELTPLVINKNIRNPLALVYRAPNNPYLDRLLRHSRKQATENQFRKGKQGAKEIVKSIRAGHHVGLLTDQKMNDGIAVPFFGMDAMTAPAIAQLALRYDCDILPCHIKRKGRSCHFEMQFEPLLDIDHSDKSEANIHKIMININQMMEGWIRQAPAQWLWLHRRWPKK